MDIDLLRKIAEYRLRVEQVVGNDQGRTFESIYFMPGGEVDALLRWPENSEKVPPGLDEINEAISAVEKNYKASFKPRMPGIMGILNVTPDSFSDGGRFFDSDAAVAQGIRMAEEGADIIDVGGESTRPGAEAVDEAEEISRVVPVIRNLVDELDGRTRISIDTFKASVAGAAVKAGADVINDISGLNFDPDMASAVADAGTDLVLMHIQGQPRTMQVDPKYSDLTGEVYAYLCDSVLKALDAGVAPEKIIIDPGIGFGKTVDHNLELLQRLRELKSMGLRVLVGASRKSMFGRILNYDEPEERIYATVAAHSVAQANGADILRAHDVRAAADAAEVVYSIMSGKHE
ncbi:MAG: dihydropteroate synthase [Planctomycetota bacterium]|jgi:dihydropteroate synthase